jgi:hypothetical protein
MMSVLFFFSCGAGDETQGLLHARSVLTTEPRPSSSDSECHLLVTQEQSAMGLLRREPSRFLGGYLECDRRGWGRHTLLT